MEPLCQEAHPDNERACVLPLGHEGAHSDGVEIRWNWTGFWEAPINTLRPYED